MLERVLLVIKKDQRGSCEKVKVNGEEAAQSVLDERKV